MAVRAVVVVVVLVCLVGVVWVAKGPAANTAVIGNANVVGGVAAVLALLLMITELWSRAAGRATAAAPVVAGQLQAAADYLAGEILRYWRTQAVDRRITTPSPAAVRWGWASEEVAVPAPELPYGAQVLTAGVVTQLREQLYDGLGGGRARVVVLGGPGAGKTAAMLLLVIDILEHRSEGSADPVPVWLTLGGWNPDTTSLLDWAAATMTRDYPGLAAVEHGGSAAARLIRSGRVALFLDGLDEMPTAVQGTAVQAVDRDAAGLRVVLTSRTDEYHSAVTQGPLYGAAVIDLLPVGVDQAQVFLLAEQLSDRRRAWQPVIDYLRAHPDSIAAQTLTTPLALSLARDTYTTGDPADLLDTDRYPSSDALRQHLLARSLTLAYPDPAQREHAIHWLSWIAQHMGTDRNLRWWDIPTWTPRWQRGLLFGLLFGLVVGLVVGLLFGLVVGLVVGLVFGLVGALVGGLVGGPLFGLMVGLVAESEDEPHLFAVRWPTPRELDLRSGLVGGLLFGLMGGLPVGLGVGLPVGLGVGLVVGLVFVLTGVMRDVWSTPLATVQAASPLRVYRADRRRTLVVGLALGLAMGLAIGLALGLMGGLLAGGLALGLAGGLALGPPFGLAGGLGPALQLGMVEVIWSLRLKRVRFMTLLQTALHKQVLRQAGTVYQFRHAALQDLLATREASVSATDATGVQNTTPAGTSAL